MSGYMIEIQGSNDAANRVEVMRGGKVIADLGCTTKGRPATPVTFLVGHATAIFRTWHLASEVGTAALWPGQQMKISPAGDDISARGRIADVESGDVLRTPAHAGATITITDPNDLTTMMPGSGG
jgi:hypothetical protein